MISGDSHPSASRLPRRLAAVLCADVAGYSRLTGAAEDATHRTLRTYLDLIAAATARHGGLVLHYAGDAVLARFDGVGDALLCAVAVQRELAMHNAGLPADRKLEFRIGVNLGDVIEDRGEVYGDGVNVAARLQSAAGPGEVWASEAVRTAAGDRLPLVFEDVGEHSLKNIARPVHAYRVRGGESYDAGTVAVGAGRPWGGLKLALAAGGGAALLAVIAALVLLDDAPPPAEDASPAATIAAVAAERQPLPNSIAVLPFESLSPDQNNAYFAAGIHEEILNRLVKLDLNVIARTSVLQYQGVARPITDIARELNVLAIMEGSVAYADGRVAVSAQLIDAATGVHLWSERYNRELADVFAIQADIATNIAEALKTELSLEDREAIERAPTASPEAYELYLRAQDTSPVDRAAALRYLQQALAIDPDFARAHEAMAVFYGESLINTAGQDAVSRADRDAQIALAREHASRALELDPALGTSHVVVGQLDLFSWRWTEALASFRLATAASGGAAGTVHLWLLSYLGAHAEAIELARHTVELDPADSFSYWALATTLVYAGSFEEARRAQLRAVELTPANPLTHLWLAYVEMVLGNRAEAVRELGLTEQLLAENRSFVYLPELAYAYSRVARREDAMRIFTEIGAAANRAVGAGTWAMAYLAIGDHDAARDALEEALGKIENEELDEGFYNLMNIKMNFLADPLLEQPPFKGLRARLRGR